MKKFSWIALVVFTCQCVETKLTGTVVSVADGDTFTMLTPDRSQLKVRLYGIDAPERGQDFSKVSKQYLSDLLLGEHVVVEQIDNDQYGRIIGLVEVKHLNVNEAMLKAGLAWHYTKFDNNKNWMAFEAEARSAQRGLWSAKHPLPPWDYRRKKRDAVRD